jgi:nicotinamide mononucleotide (NMN) deamidase PncC
MMKNFAISTMVAAAFAATALGTAGAAVATPLTCVDGGSATQCGSPGNVQITTNTPPVQFQPEFPFFGVGGIYRR